MKGTYTDIQRNSFKLYLIDNVKTIDLYDFQHFSEEESETLWNFHLRKL